MSLLGQTIFGGRVIYQYQGHKKPSETGLICQSFSYFTKSLHCNIPVIILCQITLKDTHSMQAFFPTFWNATNTI